MPRAKAGHPQPNAALMGLGVLFLAMYCALPQDTAKALFQAVDVIVDIFGAGKMTELKDGGDPVSSAEAFAQFALWWRDFRPAAKSLRKRVLKKK